MSTSALSYLLHQELGLEVELLFNSTLLLSVEEAKVVPLQSDDRDRKLT